MNSVSEKNNVSYWNEFYKKVAIDEESTFCSFIKKEIKEDVVIIDIGCGSGRDTRSFAKEGYQVYGIDRSTEAINMNNEHVKHISNIEFINIDIADKSNLQRFLEYVSTIEENATKKIMIYSRFFLHSINKETELILLHILSKNLKSEDLLVLEFRTTEDEKIEKVYNNHYRRYIDSDELKKDLETKYGFFNQYYYKGQGLSIYQNENPYLARMIFKKK
ncbi:class I SAM-dependent methyltransferase [Lysinibacillus parviboronicapiens]|uniref:class I SAM-dependent methyltransferase n=1 Tax=Lysinibacillus parviboronicapiens TaxID=436516 RepID=UPI00187D159A|nr:class I SAM-dependent methyltransferase [Lysinibacillus parviboronicapiens]